MGTFGQYDNLVHNLKGSVADAYAQVTATATGDEIQLTGGAVLFIVHVHAVGAADASNYLLFTVNQATASGGTFAAADSSQYVTNLWDRYINATTETGVKIFQFIPAATYDYVKLIATETGTADVTYSAVCLQGDLHAPVS